MGNVVSFHCESMPISDSNVADTYVYVHTCMCLLGGRWGKELQTEIGWKEGLTGGVLGRAKLSSVTKMYRNRGSDDSHGASHVCVCESHPRNSCEVAFCVGPRFG